MTPLADRLRARLAEYDNTLATPGQAQDIAEADLLSDVLAIVEQHRHALIRRHIEVYGSDPT